jgi:hypothetical protein
MLPLMTQSRLLITPAHFSSNERVDGKCSDQKASEAVASLSLDFQRERVMVSEMAKEKTEETRSETNRNSSESQLSILSPFDEKEEWNKISQIIDSFGDDIGKVVTKDSTTPNNCKI